MNDLKFGSLKEVYDRVLPALRSKVKELQRNKITYIKEEDIWNALKDTKWIKSTSLSLAEMVDDILNTDATMFMEYVHHEVAKKEVEPNTEGDSIIE